MVKKVEFLNLFNCLNIPLPYPYQSDLFRNKPTYHVCFPMIAKSNLRWGCFFLDSTASVCSCRDLVHFKCWYLLCFTYGLGLPVGLWKRGFDLLFPQQLRDLAPYIFSSRTGVCIPSSQIGCWACRPPRLSKLVLSIAREVQCHSHTINTICFERSMHIHLSGYGVTLEYHLG